MDWAIRDEKRMRTSLCLLSESRVIPLADKMGDVLSDRRNSQNYFLLTPGENKKG